eukprot:jgi/Orpsp1_1/1179063/evm.model.c7180000067789.1
MIAENYYEWTLEDFEKKFLRNKLDNSYTQFNIGGILWRIKLLTWSLQKKEGQRIFEIFLIPWKFNGRSTILAKWLWSFREGNKEDNEDFTEYHTLNVSPLYCFNRTCTRGYRKEIYRDIYDSKIKPCLKKDKIKIGIYLCIYDPGNKIDEHINRIKNYFEEDDRMIDDENYYEMVTEDWPQLTDKKKEWDQFQLGGYLWNIYAYPNRNGYVQLNLCLISAYVMKNEYFYADVVFYLRNVYDYSCIVARRWKKMQHFSNSDGLIFFEEFIKSEEVYQLKEGSSNRLLLENGKIVIGVYIRIYENDEITKLPKRKQLLNIDNEVNNNPEKTELKLKKEQYIRELKNQIIMDELENSMTFNANAENYFEFELYKFADNFIKKNFETCRFGFKLGGHRWEMNLNSIGELKKRTDNFWISLTLLDYKNMEEEEEEEEIWIKCLYSFRDIENPSNYRSFD